ncbi:RIP metalloprotease RseP [Clostridium sp. MSJ-4]|uniref:Zinc metalloprotease n=1 Tax=Clostridium simiarum TaxID=2841506 RepID=A0ABS6EWP4_9CLOT|nr:MULTISPECIES: RIP metalloprotease RseP [Clostridium]MBU5590642.1 RIP metalloprotease RseP [Clostridium simiarum]
MYIIWGILAFSLLIVGHEFGHFTLAKLNGIKVEEFSLGMGPKILGFKGKETEYMIKALPIGGYVKMLGEEDNVDDERAFSSKSPLRRISVIAAGPIMNFILALLLFTLISMNNGFVLPKINQVSPNSPAMEAGLISGDEIKSLNGNKILTWEDFSMAASNNNGNPLNLEVERAGEIKSYTITPRFNEELGKYAIGIGPTAVEKPSFGESIKHSFVECRFLIKQTFGALKTIFTGKAKLNDFGGPVTIIKATGVAAKSGIWNLLFFAALLSVQLGIFNLLPFPALDGGWIFIMFIELITRKKINDKIIGTLNYIGFSLLIIMMIAVTIKDILFPISF